MGKLHSLRRAILRNPELWRGTAFRKPIPTRDRFGNWYVYNYYSSKKSYRKFVEKVLRGA